MPVPDVPEPNLDNILITCGADGMFVAEPKKNYKKNQRGTMKFLTIGRKELRDIISNKVYI